MKKLLLLLLILVIIGILWMKSRFWEFSESEYYSQELVTISDTSSIEPDFRFLEKEFASPANEY